MQKLQKSFWAVAAAAVLYAVPAMAQDASGVNFVPRENQDAAGQAAAGQDAGAGQNATGDGQTANADAANAANAAQEAAKASAQMAAIEERMRAQQEQIDAQSKRIAELQAQVDAANAANAEEPGVGGKIADYIGDHFRFGSYGRVQPSMNPDGMRTGRQTRLVSPTPRVDEGTYVELTLAYTPFRSDDGKTVVDVVTTLALSGDRLFHNDGVWDAGLAIRNLYVEARGLWYEGLSVWAGSRMYRGDDIYLLDTWPLDNLNTYGGGIGIAAPWRMRFDVHFGTNRLDDSYQYEVVDTINERFVGRQEVVFLDRQRFISSFKLTQEWGKPNDIQFKAKLYAEVHAIDEGEYLEVQPERITKLPSDKGWVIGAQFGMSKFLDDSFFNIFIRYAEGLAAYGDLAIPFGIATDLSATDAQHLIAGVSMGLDICHYVDILLGGYVRYFRDSDGIEEDFDDGVEGVWDIRISGRVGDYFRPGVEFSQQLRRPNGLSPVTLKQETASIFKFSLLPAVRFGDGILGRPEIRFNYTLSVLNDAAQNIFPEKDYLRGQKYVHFIGFAAEWWFNI